MLAKRLLSMAYRNRNILRKLILAEVLTGKQWQMDRDQAKQLIYEVNRIGNNVNQITYSTNVKRFWS